MEEHLKFLGYELIETITDGLPSWLRAPIYRIKTPTREFLLAFCKGVHPAHGGSAIQLLRHGESFVQIKCYVGASAIEALYLILPHKENPVQ